MPDLRLLALTLLAVVVSATGGYFSGRHDGRALEAAQQAKARTAALTQQAADYQDRLDRQEADNRVTLKQAAQAKADLDDARATGDRLQHDLDAFRRTAKAQCPAALPAGAPDASPVDLLAELFRESDERAGILAGALDDAARAGSKCEREYDALRLPAE